MRFCRRFLFLALTIRALGQMPEAASIHHSPTSTQSNPRTQDSRVYVGGVNYPLTQAGVQQNWTDACNLSTEAGINTGGDSYLSPGVISVAGRAGQLFTAVCPLGIHGSTGESTIFNIAGEISSAIPIFRFQALANVAQIGYHIDHMIVQSATGIATAGDLFLFDSGSGGLPGPLSVEVDHIVTNQGAVNGYDINQAGNIVNPGQNNFYIHDSMLQNGIRFAANSGDAQLIEHNMLHSRAGSGHPCVDVNSMPGAAHFVLDHNDADSCDAGVVFVHFATQPKITYNQFESSFSCTGPNSAMIDFQGDVGTIDGGEINGNNLNAQTMCLRNIRLNNSTNTHVVGNRITANPTGGIGIDLAGARGVTIGPNPGTFGGTSLFVVGDTPTRKVRVYANMNAGEPDTRAIAPSDADNAIVARRNSATQSAALFRCEDETAAEICSITPAGQFISNARGGTGVNASFEAVGAAQPSLDLNNTSGPGDSKVWDLSASPTSLVFRTISDANNKSNTFLTVNRSGLTPTSVIFAAGPVVQNAFNRVAVVTNFTTANNTSLQAIPGLSWALPAEARNYSFHCSLSYSQAKAAVSDNFGIQAATNAPINIFVNASVQTAQTVYTGNTVPTINTTTPTNVVTFTPSATASNFTATLDGTIENPASANKINIMVSTSVGADAVTVLRGSYCNLY